MFLQNHQGLDFLFLKEGDLCAVFGEQCYLYANTSGGIQETLNMVQINLDARGKACAEASNWYQSLFSWSPWLITH